MLNTNKLPNEETLNYSSSFGSYIIALYYPIKQLIVISGMQKHRQSFLTIDQRLLHTQILIVLVFYRSSDCFFTDFMLKLH